MPGEAVPRQAAARDRTWHIAAAALLSGVVHGTVVHYGHVHHDRFDQVSMVLGNRVPHSLTRQLSELMTLEDLPDGFNIEFGGKVIGMAGGGLRGRIRLRQRIKLIRRELMGLRNCTP